MRQKQLILWGVGLLAAIITIPLMSADRSLAAVALPEGNENTVILAQNAGSGNADIIADYYNQDGTIIPAATEQFTSVPPGGVVNIAQATNTGLPTGYRGLAVISSTQPVNALIVRDILAQGNLKSYSIASAFPDGGHELALPILFNELLTSQWNSRMAIVNTGSDLACIAVDYTLLAGKGGAATTNQTITDSPTGQAGCANGYALAGGGQITFGRAGTGVTQFPTSTMNNQMAARVRVLNPTANNEIVSTVDIYRSDGNRLMGSYSGLVVDGDNPDIGTDVIAPIGIKSQSGYYTVLGVQNVGDAPTDVTVHYVGEDMETGDPIDVTVTLPNVEVTAEHSTYSAGTNVPVGFIGYARVTSTEPVAVMEVRGKLTSSDPENAVNTPLYSAFNGVPVANAATDWNLPLIFRRFLGDVPTTYGYNSWIQVQVADGSTAQVTLRFVGDPERGGECGEGTYERTYTVDGSRVFLMFSDDSEVSGFPANNQPSCFFGGAQVSSNKDVIVISNVTNDFFPNSDIEGTYDGFPAN